MHSQLHINALELNLNMTQIDSQRQFSTLSYFAVPNVSAEFCEFAKIMLGLKRGQQPLQCCEYKRKEM